MSTTPNLSRLIEMAKGVRMSAEQASEQRNSFVYGNTRTENPRITREMVERKGLDLSPEPSPTDEKRR